MSPNLHHLCRSHRSLEKVNRLPQSCPQGCARSNKDTDLREKGSRFGNMTTAEWERGEKVTRIARINRSLSACLLYLRLAWDPPLV